MNMRWDIAGVTAAIGVLVGAISYIVALENSVKLLNQTKADVSVTSELSGKISGLEDDAQKVAKELEGALGLINKEKKDALELIEKKKEELYSEVKKFNVVPVGTILSFVGNMDQLAKMPQWKLCDGSILLGEKYKNSPFYNRQLPKFENVFIRATLDSSVKLKFAGKDNVKHNHSLQHSHGIPHTHSGTTSGETKHGGPKTDCHNCGGIHTHTFTTGGPSTPRTAGANIKYSSDETINVIPKHVNALFIIKVI